MRKLLIIIGVLAFAASASADEWNDTLKEIDESFMGNHFLQLKQAEWENHFTEAGASCERFGDKSGPSVSICIAGDKSVMAMGKFSKVYDVDGRILTLYGVGLNVDNGFCPRYFKAALENYGKPTAAKNGVYTWKRKQTSTAEKDTVATFAKAGAMFPSWCLYTTKAID